MLERHLGIGEVAELQRRVPNKIGSGAKKVFEERGIAEVTTPDDGCDRSVTGPVEKALQVSPYVRRAEREIG